MRAAVREKGATVRNGQESDLTQYEDILTKLLGRVDARVLRGPLGSFGAPGDVVARCCLVALAEDSRGASSFEVENGTTMRRRRVAQHPNNRDSK